jgi:hypothetical protein
VHRHGKDNDVPRRCRACYYVLDGLTAPRCPECGSPFQPDDPHTYFVGSLFRWRLWRRRRQIVCATMAWLGLLLLAYSLRYYYHRAYCVEICKLCAASERYQEHFMGSISIFRERLSSGECPVHDFLAERIGAHEHQWTRLTRYYKDWWGIPGPILDVKDMALGFRVFEEATCNVEALNKVSERIEECRRGSDEPMLRTAISRLGSGDLASLIQQGILQEPDLRAANERARALFRMCEAKDGADFRAAVVRWANASHEVQESARSRRIRRGQLLSDLENKANPGATRAVMADALVEFRDSEVQAALAKAEQDSDAAVSHAASRALEKMRTGRSVPFVVPLAAIAGTILTLGSVTIGTASLIARRRHQKKC